MTWRKASPMARHPFRPKDEPY
jgi:hypothetical protein